MDNVVVLCLLLVELSSSSTQETLMYFKEGGSLTLDLRPFPPKSITSILWTCDGDLLVDCCESKHYYAYRGTATLDMHTGRLLIRNMTEADQGVYSVETNNEVQGETYNAVMIKPVPTPEVRVSPLTARGPCKLTCEGDTTGAGPVTYSWKSGDGEWKELQKDIMEEEHGRVNTFTCRMKNPLSEEESPARTILFVPGEPAASGLWIKVFGAGIKCLAILALLGAVVYALWSNQEPLRRLMCPRQRTNCDY
ncbi:hypothetical protein CesoFtcFv8_019481 [Champsocephalus esox]|uniref:Ig-like domain-containing protein n=1 Tax=Champsocephalus esox TaxID=159716 RepID=A0AAN8GMN5_9TELE|nr:hypothetical protein CesoFtcFv8_019481 [Champsocephalus esox]